MARGCDWYEKARPLPTASPAIPRSPGGAGPSQDEPLFCEEVSYAAYRAFERITGDEDGFLRRAEQARHSPERRRAQLIC